MDENSQETLLIVDDIPANLKLLSKILKEKGYRVRPVPSGRLALQSARSSPPDMILLDISMPEMNGYEVCQHLKADHNLKEIPVIFISALDETLDKVKAFSLGGVDYITKPFQIQEVYARIETHLKLRTLQKELAGHNRDLQDKVKEKVRELYESQMATIFALAKLAESRDEDTGKHLERVQNFCKLLAINMSKKPRFESLITPDFIENIFNSSPLHDIGKVGIPDKILLKPGRLTEEEFEIMKQHTVMGADTLSAVRNKYHKNVFVNMGIEIARSHHERWEGGGYPDGLKGGEIPLSARIMAISDVYDALRSERCYKPPFSHEKSLDIIRSQRGKQFDPDVMDAFEELHEQFQQIRKEVGD